MQRTLFVGYVLIVRIMIRGHALFGRKTHPLAKGWKKEMSSAQCSVLNGLLNAEYSKYTFSNEVAHPRK